MINIYFMVLVVFASLGVILGGAILHEYVHFFDFKDEVENIEIKVFLPTELNKEFLSGRFGEYRVDRQLTKEELLLSEVKAYSAQFLLLILFVFSLLKLRRRF